MRCTYFLRCDRFNDWTNLTKDKSTSFSGENPHNCLSPVCKFWRCFGKVLFLFPQSNTSSPQSQRPADLSDDEVSELFQRLAEVQQEKWMLEEKVWRFNQSLQSHVTRKSLTRVAQRRFAVLHLAFTQTVLLCAPRGALSAELCLWIMKYACRYWCFHIWIDRSWLATVGMEICS